MPSRSMTESNHKVRHQLGLVAIRFERGGLQGNVPGTPSYSNVAQMRSGATTSW